MDMLGGARPVESYLRDSARTTVSRLQALVLACLGLAIIGVLYSGIVPANLLVAAICGLWLAIAAWRLVCLHQAQPIAVVAAEPIVWPRYTVVAALYDEAAILPQLIQRLSQIDYPADRLQGFIALEADDLATRLAAETVARPDWLQILVVPPGSPKTKPRALNHALERATGDLITIYDAEDDPDPLQLKEAAARFMAEPADLVCLQAPLRIRCRDKSRSTSPFLDTHFAVEYAALFEVTLPALARLGMPFPLGGTSNHFRVGRLREIGGWDAWNVTEDADLGFRIWRTGGRLGVLSRPTYETPPGDLRLWLPQRTRWIKGYLQTLLLHTRHSVGMGPRGWLAMGLTIGAGTLSASVHAISVAWVAAISLTALVSGQLPPVPPLASATFLIGTIATLLVAIEGARRAGVRFKPWDMVIAPAYWSLLTLAFVHALARLVFEPHRWDKTPHRPEVEREDEAKVFGGAGRQAA